MHKIIQIPFVTVIENGKWKTAVKTKAIFARPIVTLFNDIHVINKLQLVTLEGPQKVKEGMLLCTGLSKIDPWQQTPKQLLEKYTVTDITNDGWMYCEPKPDNAIRCFKVSQSDLNYNQTEEYDLHSFQIYGKSGTEVVTLENKKAHIQVGEVGDYICQSLIDASDVWIVKESFFNSTYQIT